MTKNHCRKQVIYICDDTTLEGQPECKFYIPLRQDGTYSLCKFSVLKLNRDSVIRCSNEYAQRAIKY
jgi:hypothetical protein